MCKSHNKGHLSGYFSLFFIANWLLSVYVEKVFLWLLMQYQHINSIEYLYSIYAEILSNVYIPYIQNKICKNCLFCLFLLCYLFLSSINDFSTACKTAWKNNHLSFRLIYLRNLMHIIFCRKILPRYNNNCSINDPAPFLV